MKLTPARALRNLLWVILLIVFGALLYLSIILTDTRARDENTISSVHFQRVLHKSNTTPSSF